MDQSDERDYAEEAYNRDLCPECDYSPCICDNLERFEQVYPEWTERNNPNFRGEADEPAEAEISDEEYNLALLEHIARTGQYPPDAGNLF